MNKRNRKNGAAAARGDKKVTHSERVRGRYLMGCAGKEEEKVGLCVETKISRGFGNAVSQKKTCLFLLFFSFPLFYGAGRNENHRQADSPN